jgi:hypothetical protein
MLPKCRILAAWLLVAGLWPTTGCFSVVTRAYYELRGAKGTINFVEPMAVSVPDQCKSIHFEPATTTVGPRLCPPEVQAAYDRDARQLVQDLRQLFPGGAPTLEVSSEIMYFQKKGLFGDAELLVRVRFAEDRQPVGDALVVAGSKAFREGGAAALAEASIKTLGKFLRERTLPEEERGDGRKGGRE